MLDDMIKQVDDLINKLKEVGQDGIPVKHSVDPKTMTSFGVIVIVGLVLCGLAAGVVAGLIVKRD